MFVVFLGFLAICFFIMLVCLPRRAWCVSTQDGAIDGTRVFRPLRIAAVTEVRRRLPLATGRNFRDLGGLPACDGHHVAPGLLFRADDLTELCPEDLVCLAAIPIITVIDFRSAGEASRHPDRLPPSVRKHIFLPLVPGKLEPWNPDEGLRAKGGYGFMTDIYRSLVLDEECIAVYREFFRHVQQEDCLPLLFHCSAGKDRTGMAAAFTLFSLGVDRETILRDYMESNICLAGKYDYAIAKNPERAAIFFADPGYLLAAVAAMEGSSGSVDRYLAAVLGVNLKAMRDRFLQ